MVKELKKNIRSRGKALLFLTIIFTIVFVTNLNYLFENGNFEITKLDFYFLITLFCFAHLTGHYIEFWTMRDLINESMLQLESDLLKY